MALLSRGTEGDADVTEERPDQSSEAMSREGVLGARKSVEKHEVREATELRDDRS